MKKYITYNKQGDIIKTGVCPDDMLHLMADPMREEFVTEGEANGLVDKISDFKPVKRDKPLKHPAIPKKRLPPINTFVEAYVKTISGDDTLKAEGEQELQEYVNKYLKMHKKETK